MMNYSFTVPSMLILVIIVGYYFCRPRLPVRMNRAFLAIITIDLCTVLFDYAASRLNETWELHSPVLLWIANLLFLVFYMTRTYMFFVYTASVLETRGASRSRLHAYVPAVYFPCVAFALSSPLTHWMFRIDGEGYHQGPLYSVLYACSALYLLFSLVMILRHRRRLSTADMVGLYGVQLVLAVGYIVHGILSNYLVMNTFCMLAILVIFLSFQNPDLFLSDRGYVYNLPALRALLMEWHRRKQSRRMLGFVIQNYNEHREIFGGQQMDEALTRVNRHLKTAYPALSAFYLRNGCYVITGADRTDMDEIRDQLEARFTMPWKTSAGELLMNISFLQADVELESFTADRLINTLLISLDEAGEKNSHGERGNLSDSMAAISQKLEIRRCLERALEENTLEVFLQPIVDSATGKKIAAEALVRLRDDNGKIIRPDLFITIAEREGRIAKLGEQVLRKVCAFIRNHDMEELGLQWINVNLSPNQFMSRNIPERFQRILREYGVPPKRIHLEITEQSMVDFSVMRDQILALHEYGFEFALDDYGSGYSNLTRVRQYPFSNIKIDMEVVRNYCSQQDSLVPALVDAFKQMHFTVTAEGIENEEMAEMMRNVGCDYFQGYYFGKPVSISDFLAQAAGER